MARHRSATALTHAAPVDPVMVGRARDLLERAHVLFDNADGVDDDVERFRQLYLVALRASGAALAVHVGAPLLTAVVAAGRSGTVLAIAAAGLAVNLAGNGLLVADHGMVGAAVSTLVTEGLVAVLAFVALLVPERAGR